MGRARRYVRFTASLLLAMLALALAGCHTQAPALLAADGSLQKTWYDAEVKAADGSLLRMTVYQPALRPPLLILAHGLGLLVQGHSKQFRLGGRGWGTAATTVAGRIGLSLAAAGE